MPHYHHPGGAARLLINTRASADPGFSPSQVSQIAAGYWWDAALGVTNLGAANFNWAEQNGKTTGDQVQVTTSRQPAAINANGYGQFRFDKSIALGGTGTLTATTNTLQVGWTGATYVCGRFRVAGPAAVLTNRFFSHSLTAGNQRRLEILNSSDVAVQMSLSTDGIVANAVTFAMHPFDVEFFAEFVFNPAAASGLRGEMWVNRVQQALTSGGITIASLFDGNSRMAPAGNSGATEHGYVTDCGWCAYANGIPSDSDRNRLYGYKAA